MPLHTDPFEILERTDKWYLGNGNATLYAPAFPKFADTPGFWDEVYFADIRLERLFCILVLNEKGRPLNLKRAIRRWTPDRLLHIYTVEGIPTIQIQEERVITPNHTLISRLTIKNRGTEPILLNLLLWSLQSRNPIAENETGSTLSEVWHEIDSMTFTHTVRYGGAGETPAEVYGWGEHTSAEAVQDHSLYVALGASRLADSWTVNASEMTDTSPLWQISPFPEKFAEGVLPGELQWDAGWNPKGLVHLAMHFTVEVIPSTEEQITFGAGIGLDQISAEDSLRASMIHDPIVESRKHWETYFESVPYFACSDPALETAYWYRWYGLHLQTVRVNTGNLPHPCIFEGLGAFRSHITYSAQCHVRETSWMSDSTLAKGCMLNFLENQVLDGEEGENGFLPGHLYLWRQDRGFYHADWGGMALQLYYLTGDGAFIQRIYPSLVRYAEYFDEVRDKEHSGLYDVQDQGETGQEYMSRYLFVDSNADSWRKIQVKGVDSTFYLYRLQRALAEFARLLQKREEALHWNHKADTTREAMRSQMWDAEAKLFKDVHPQTGERSPYKAAVGFYPFLSDVVRYEHLDAWKHITNPRTFGTPYPVPASSIDDPYFSAEAEWRGKRTNCPWNGRVWPMTNSHVCAALAHTALHIEPKLRPLAVQLISTFIRMLFTDGDLKRPNCYEHYNPYTGMPSLYRGVDDYQHSWIVDIILQYVAGVQVEPGIKGRLVIDPLPFSVQSFQVEGLHIRGHWVDVFWDEVGGFRVRVDGEVRVQRTIRERVEVEL